MRGQERRQNETQQYNGITQGVIWQQLLLFFFPLLFGTFFQMLYNTTDAVIVGRFVGTVALSAIGGAASQIVNVIVGAFLGLASVLSISGRGMMRRYQRRFIPRLRCLCYSAQYLWWQGSCWRTPC